MLLKKAWELQRRTFHQWFFKNQWDSTSQFVELRVRLVGRKSGKLCSKLGKGSRFYIDENLKPRISDFGIVKLSLKKHDLVSLYENGTYGARIDEMACGRRPVDVDVDEINSSKVHFLLGSWCTQTWPSDCPSNNRVLEMLEMNLNDPEASEASVHFGSIPA
ncbi:hypothetical protein Goari_027511 [Gossypium aridum]|uniref:Uncharacterized protein n=1 Tax=Gossypium aridum TaxID=34290 RepID=A0A7J8YV18_GOSAI|nr:hypothetical protein [Gossypium aridum]